MREAKLHYISIEEALVNIGKFVKVEVEPDVISINEVYGRILAEDVVSDVDIPPRNMSRFDGYSVKAEDTGDASVYRSVNLKVISRIYPGEIPTVRINHGQACYVGTGAYLPEGCNTVLPVEMAKLIDENTIEVRRCVMPGENITVAGKDVRKGEAVLKRGRSIRAQDIVLLANIGKWDIKVFRRPIVAVFSVGDELTDNIKEVSLGNRFDSHKLMICKLIEELGGIPLNLGIAPDKMEVIKERLVEGLKKAEIVATIGGASIGKRDYVARVIDSLGSPGITIRGVKILPGRVSSLGVIDGKPIVLLPGHIQSTIVGFYTLLAPLIRLMSGLPIEVPYPTIRAKSSKKVVERTPFPRVRFVRLIKRAKGFELEPIPGESSLISIPVKADGFMMIPKGVTVLEEGEEVLVHLFPGMRALNWWEI